MPVLGCPPACNRSIPRHGPVIARILARGLHFFQRAVLVGAKVFAYGDRSVRFKINLNHYFRGFYVPGFYYCSPVSRPPGNLPARFPGYRRLTSSGL